MSKVVLITGASAGIGKETARLLAQSGYVVYGGARRVENMQDLSAFGVTPVHLDVTREESLVACVEQIVTERGGIDVLINNAGFGSYGSVEDVTLKDARYQLEVNLFGAARLMQLVLPRMRERGFGKLVNVSSIGGKVAGPMGGWYHASKFALEGLSDSLRNEVKAFGIDVIVIEPGATKSEWGSFAFDSLMEVSGKTAYRELANKVHQSFSAMAKGSVEALQVARVIKTSVEARHPKARYTCDFTGKALLFSRNLLSDKQFDRLLMSQIK